MAQKTIEIKTLIDELNDSINKAGSALTQGKYQLYFNLVFEKLDILEEHLGGSRFLNGDEISDEDSLLYDILARFDTAYYFAYALNKKRIRDYDNLWNYAKELYSIPSFKRTTDFEAIKRRYLVGPLDNPDNIVPDGPDNSLWEEPNNRALKFGGAAWQL